jgi:hypothetical protein
VAYVRLTVNVRNVDGAKARVRATTQRKKQNLLRQSVKEAEATFDLAQALCPRDTEYMANHMRLDFTREGFNWVIGFRREDFVGQTNPVTGLTITDFYPLFVVEGTRFQAGNDFLRAAMKLRAAQIRAAYREALRRR